MKTASQVIDAAGKEVVERAIAEAESKTGAEIVVVVATRSGLYDRAEDLFGLLSGLACVAVAEVVWRAATGGGWWPAGGMWLGLGPVLVIVAAGGVAGAGLATWVPALARPFVTRGSMEENVRTAGAAAFVTNRMGRTAGRAGVLVYVSLLERTSWIVGDEEAEKVLAETALDAVRDDVVGAFGSAHAAEGLAGAIRRLGGLLAEGIPARAANPDEVPNAVVLID
jgi:putative membrane protein